MNDSPNSTALACTRAREQLSARLDGELRDDRALLLHLAACAECRAHERILVRLARGFEAVREPETTADLWPAIERGLSVRRAPPVLLRIAAGLVGFLGLAAVARLVERASPAAPGRHLFERLEPVASDPDALFAALPEYRLLRALPTNEEPR